MGVCCSVMLFFSYEDTQKCFIYSLVCSMKNSTINVKVHILLKRSSELMFSLYLGLHSQFEPPYTILQSAPQESTAQWLSSVGHTLGFYPHTQMLDHDILV